MYLKSLVLKGFKSFADRSVLTVEPGITAIVGPNGSGKSNISDAVLWVLGERSAKNLRGQAMEDVIFAGSAARKAVSVAEVELVLDNSDRTIPVEFDEVSIARRMYRSGESEYLVNGAIVRRLDVLDILHDSGLGTGTHSIISQGSLDSVLQSKPEDRRALIEEAAGILKHKQRKEKSARKIEAMDHHLDRARDVAAEIERQLKPLERKAKRAQAYQEASSQLAELKLSIAVDDLRNLQERWERVCADEKNATEVLEESRGSVAQAERAVSAAQEAIRRDSLDAGELARKQRRGEQVAERLDSCELLLRERKRSAQDIKASMQLSLDGFAARMNAAQADLSEARARSTELESSIEKADGAVVAASEEVQRMGEERQALEQALRESESNLQTLGRQLEAAQRNKNDMQEQLSNSLAHEKLVEARKHEASLEVDRAKQAHAESVQALDDAKALLDELDSANERAQAETVRLFAERESARAEQQGKDAELHMHETELKALENALKSERSGNSALSWIAGQSETIGSAIEPIVKAIRAPRDIEDLVERLIGEDIVALAVQDETTAARAARLVMEESLMGDVRLFPRARKGARASVAAQGNHGTPLADLLVEKGESTGLVDVLFADVVLCDTLEEAIEAHEGDKAGLRFASRDGCVVWPSGKIQVFGATKERDEGVLARERRCDELRQEIEHARGALAKLIEKSAQIESDYRDTQAVSLKANQELAGQKGLVSSAKADEARAAERLALATRELEGIISQHGSAQKAVSEIRPKLNETIDEIERIEEARRTEEAKRDELAREIEPLRIQHAEASERLSSAKLELASLSQQGEYARRMVIARERDVEQIEQGSVQSRRSVLVKNAVIERAQAAVELFEKLAVELQRKTARLDGALAAAKSATDDVHARARSARDEARRAQDVLDAATSRMTDIRIEKSRLEVQVDAAVKAVVSDCGTPLDRAQTLPPLEDRRQTEDDLFKLERRIKNMGAINPDAAEEYAALKERYDYLAGQLSDLEEARKSLVKISTVIDRRMKGDFARTFDEVNTNFGEIFSLLFPGGTANLVLEDPDDIENSGVEVTAQPRGKRLSKMMLMSGGEKSLTALALLFAVYKTRSTPFYILDEVEAALDDTNLRRLISYIDTLRADTQLIMITHQRRTMEMADVLFGVSMQSDGVTKVISQKLERALDQAE